MARKGSLKDIMENMQQDFDIHQDALNQIAKEKAKAEKAKKEKKKYIYDCPAIMDKYNINYILEQCVGLRIYTGSTYRFMLNQRILPNIATTKLLASHPRIC